MRRDRIAPPRPFRHTLHIDRAPQGAPPTAPEKGKAHIASPRQCRHAPHTDRTHPGAPPTGQKQSSHGVPQPISAHPSHRLCPTRNSTYGPCGRIHTDRAPQGAPATAPERMLAAVPTSIRYTPSVHPSHGSSPIGRSTDGPRGFAWRPPTYFGTPLTRIVPRKGLHLWHQWQTSHGFPTLISANASRLSRSTRSSAYSGRARAGATHFTRSAPHREFSAHPPGC